MTTQGIFFPKLGHFFQFLKKGRGDLTLPPFPPLVTRLLIQALNLGCGSRLLSLSSVTGEAKIQLGDLQVGSDL